MNTISSPEPRRTLGAVGRDYWDRHAIHLSIDQQELLLLLCEQLDERAILRVHVLRNNDGEQRRALRQLDFQIGRGLAMIDQYRMGAQTNAASARGSTKNPRIDQSQKSDLVSAAKSNDRRSILEALRDELAVALQAADVAVKAQLAGQLRAVVAELAELPQFIADSPLEAAKRKRAARRANLKAVE